MGKNRRRSQGDSSVIILLFQPRLVRFGHSFVPYFYTVWDHGPWIAHTFLFSGNLYFLYFYRGTCILSPSLSLVSMFYVLCSICILWLYMYRTVYLLYRMVRISHSPTGTPATVVVLCTAANWLPLSDPRLSFAWNFGVRKERVKQTMALSATNSSHL